MYKVLIVDDEKMIRMGMKRAIPWNTLGISEVLLAKSGKEALDVIREEKPQILITDIHMDGMTGLDLIDAAVNFVPEIRIIVLTGFDNFEYAQRCIKLNVHDFFLKPIDEKQLMTSVKKQAAFLEQNKIKNLEDINENRANAVTEQMNIEKFLRDLVHNKTLQSDRQISDFCRKYNYDMEQNIQVAIIVPPLHMESRKEDQYFISLSIKNICISMVDAQNRGLTFMDELGRIIIAFFLNRQKKSILERIQELNGILKDEYSKKAKIVVGNPVSGMKNLSLSYQDALYLLQNDSRDYEEIIQTMDAQKRDNLFKDVFIELKNTMYSEVENSERILAVFETFCRSTYSYNLSDSYIIRCCFEIASLVYYAYFSTTREEADNRLALYLNSLSNVTGEEALELTRQFLTKLLCSGKEQNIHEIITKAKRYINENLSNDLSVSEIASYLYITPNYLSKLFKKITGEGCNEYIVRKRIEKAKLLLETTNLKASKIALLVGYNDTNYFSLAFKKNTGLCPKKYRELNQQY